LPAAHGLGDPLTLTKAESQGAPYQYEWSTVTAANLSCASKLVNGTRQEILGVDDATVLTKINAVEGFRVSRGLPAR
jgi:hypothetical protein